MSKVRTHMTMSLDGFVADPGDGIGELFEWYEAGDVDLPNPNDHVTFRVDESSSEVLRDLTANCGALVAGRRLFDIADGWGDHHPSGAPVVVVTHHPPQDAATRWPRTSFVPGVEAPRSPRRAGSPVTATS
ncbi:dihydrofolate reductase family protein [Isoptericola sp. NPDC057391]|uniref:dihydrofolate reductase family protein n=1 Tax=Isoptericola sp. NPDC057391 TaxID=3346117 RepID=UPI00362C8A6C